MQELTQMGNEIMNIIMVVDASQLHKVLVESVVHFSGRDIPGLFFSSTKPTRLFQEELIKEKVDVQKIIFLESMVDESNAYKNVVFVQTLEDLTGISIVLEEFIKEPAQEKYILIDSLDLLKMYNDQEMIVNFVSRITQLCILNKTHCIMMTSKKDNDDFINKVTPFFKKVLFKT